MLAKDALDHIHEDALVRIVYKPRTTNTFVETEGKLHAVIDGSSILIRLKGTQKPDILQWTELELIEEIKVRPKQLKGRTCKVATLYDVREHLVERHGVKISWINQVDNTKAQAMHDNIDHRDLGHLHSDSLPNGKTRSLMPDDYMKDEVPDTRTFERATIGPFEYEIPRGYFDKRKSIEVPDQVPDDLPDLKPVVRLETLDW